MHDLDKPQFGKFCKPLPDHPFMAFIRRIALDHKPVGNQRMQTERSHGAAGCQCRHCIEQIGHRLGDEMG